MTRANVVVREGRWYWECKVIRGVKPPVKDEPGTDDTNGAGQATSSSPQGPGRHLRIGYARREASLDAPVGFDAYSYGLRDVAGQKTHMSRPKDFFPAGEEIQEGDVIGMEMYLPSLALHRKIVSGEYNPAVDTNETATQEMTEALDIIRDRLPIRYKNHLYFEQCDYHPTKELEELWHPATAALSTMSGTAPSPEPSPIHPQIPMRTLPGSYIRVYKNGKCMGTPFTDLFAFLPRASKPLMQAVAREGLDDGMLGYFPAVSAFRGGAAAVNFGPEFWYPPVDDPDVDMAGNDGVSRPNMPIRPLAERYDEQIALDVLYDIVDEVDLWLQDSEAKRMKHEEDEMQREAAQTVVKSETTGSHQIPDISMSQPVSVEPGGETREATETTEARVKVEEKE